MVTVISNLNVKKVNLMTSTWSDDVASDKEEPLISNVAFIVSFVTNNSMNCADQCLQDEVLHEENSDIEKDDYCFGES